jgi:hypothetical protein
LLQCISGEPADVVEPERRQHYLMEKKGKKKSEKKEQKKEQPPRK